jgi:hypothetical protein
LGIELRDKLRRCPAISHSVSGMGLSKKERVPGGPTLKSSYKPFEMKHRLYNAKHPSKARGLG